MDKFYNLLNEAKQLRETIGVLYNLPNSDKVRLQRLWDKTTERIIRRMSNVWLLEAMK